MKRIILFLALFAFLTGCSDSVVENSEDQNNEEISENESEEVNDDVLSEAYPDATFVIHLEFEGEKPSNSFVVAIDRGVDSITGVRLARVAREWDNYDTPYFVTDSLIDWDGNIVVTNFDTNETVDYIGNPMKVTFDESGNCEQGDIVTITIKN